MNNNYTKKLNEVLNACEQSNLMDDNDVAAPKIKLGKSYRNGLYARFKRSSKCMTYNWKDQMIKAVLLA